MVFREFFNTSHHITSHPSHNEFYPLMGHELSEQYDSSMLLVLRMTSYH
jgi:hypothetical protein